MTSWVPFWLDAFLIAPFRWPAHATLGMWLGCSFLSLYCIIIGKIIGSSLMYLHHAYYAHLHDDMHHYHKVSMQALHAGNKEAYFAANTLAHDSFGKHFFAKASVNMASLVPVPFALAWMALRFEGIAIHTLPRTSLSVGYVFIFLLQYILYRLIWSRIRG